MCLVFCASTVFVRIRFCTLSRKKGAKAITLRKDADGGGWKCYSIKPKPTKATPHAFTFTTARDAKPLDKGYP
jgi:hypothetical protein